MKKSITVLILTMLKYMLIGIFLQCFFLTLMLANATTAQRQSISEIHVTLDVEGTILDVFKAIEQETEFRFSYTQVNINTDQKLSIHANNETLRKVLENISRETNLSFKRINESIHAMKLNRSEERISEVINDEKEISVNGKVTSEDAPEGLPGVNVLVKGTSTGTVTDVKGNYKITVPDESATLVFSSIGYLTDEITVGTQTVIDVNLFPDVKSLQEIVVIGYGTAEKKDITGAIGSVEAKDIVRANPVQTAKSLQGQVAGVNVRKNKGRPGEGYTIDIRGESSFDFSNEPLVVIDGVMGGNMNNLNPSDIESIDVLKDASSTAIYGSRGANGVIIITTKKGISGKPKVSYSGYAGAKVNAHVPDMMDAQQFYQAYNVERVADGLDPRGWTSTEVANATSGKSTDWIDLVTDPALQMGHSLSVSGGSDNTTYNFSGGYLDEGGNTLHTGYKRYTIKGGLDSKINNLVKVGFTAYYTYSKQRLSSTEALRSAYRSRPTGTLYYRDLLNPAESSDIDWNGYAVWMGISDKQVLNPLVEIDPENYRRETRTSNILGNAFAEFTPFKGLSLRSSISASVTDIREGEYRGTFTKSNKTTQNPTASLNTIGIETYTWDNILTYNLNEGSHNLTVTGLYSVFQQKDETSNLAVQDLPFASLWHNMGTGNITEFGTNLIERSLLSYMGRINYAFKDRYLLTLTGRSDGASQLSEGNKWAFFPSAAIAWRLGSEPFIQNLNLFSDLKLRASYGVVGNATVDPYQTKANISQTAYDYDGTPAYGFAINNLANRDLIWEKSKELNLGLNIGFLNNRITTAIELYDRRTDDLILNNKLPTSKGFGDVVANVGEVQNKGIEVTLNTVNITQENFRWNTNITFSSNHNEVLKLADGQTEDAGNNRFVGESIRPNYYYKFDGIWQTSEKDLAESYGQNPGEVRVVDQNNDGQISANDDRVILGSQLPKLLMGITNKFYFKNLDFSFLIYTRHGAQYRNEFLKGTFGEIESDRYNGSADLDYWTTSNPSKTYYALIGSGPYREAIQYQNADFWRISDITLGYTFPRTFLDHLNISNLRVYGQVDNPFIFTDYMGFSPEYNSGVNDDDVPSAVILFGLDVSF